MTVNQSNSNDLNRLAESLLLKAGEEASPAYPYSLQLALYALEKHPQRVSGLLGKYREEVLGLAQAALGAKSKKALSLVLNLSEPGLSPQSAQATLAKELKGKSPEQAGAVLVENLYWNLAEDNPRLLGPVGQN